MNDITNFIGIGKENAVTRKQLVSLLGLPDRRVRRMIAEAREHGAPIINDQDGYGYYLSNDLYELRRQYITNRSRALSIMRQQRSLREKIEEAENRDQMKLDEVMEQ